MLPSLCIHSIIPVCSLPSNFALSCLNHESLCPLRYIAPHSLQPRHLAPPVPLQRLATPWNSYFSNISSSDDSSSVFTTSLCCGSSLQPATLSLSPSSSSSSSQSTSSPPSFAASHESSFNSLHIGRPTQSPAAPSAVVVPYHLSLGSGDASSSVSSSLIPRNACLVLPKSSLAPFSTAPFAAARFDTDSAICTSAACTSAASQAHLLVPFSTSSQTPSLSIQPSSSFAGHTIMGCAGGGFGGCSIAVRFFSRVFCCKYVVDSRSHICPCLDPDSCVF
jgi:hypothetical protein